MPYLIPILAAAAGIASTIINARKDKKQNQATNQANMELAKFTNEKNLELWEKQNAYNAPAAQMERFGAAGLNPQLAYLGQSNAGNASSPPQLETPTVDMRTPPIHTDLPQTLGMFQDFQYRQAQINNVKAQTENINSRTVTEKYNAIAKDLQGQHGAFDLDTKQGLRPYQFFTKELETRRGQAELNNALQRFKLMRIDELNRLLETQTKEKNLTSIDLQQEKMQAEILFQKYKNEWMKQGVTTSDHPLLRIMSRMANQTQLTGPGNETYMPWEPLIKRK